MAIFIWFAVLGVSYVVAFGAANWAAARSTATRNTTAFLLSAAAAYSASFVVDIWAQTASGSIRGGSNVILPSITWLLITLVAAIATIATKGSTYAVALPYAIVAGLAFMVSSAHKQNQIVGLVFIVFTVIIALIQSRSLRAVNIDNPLAATQQGVQADRP